MEPQVFEYDFTSKTCVSGTIDRVAAAMAEGRFVWIDIDFSNLEAARRVLSYLALVADPILEDAFSAAPGTQLGRYNDYLHLVVSGCRIDAKGALSLERVDVIAGEKFLMTLHKAPRTFLEMVRRDHESDFVRFAKSPSFLLYEIWDSLLEHYVDIQKKLESRVHALQQALFVETQDRVFTEVSDIGANLLHFRSVLVPARTVLTELSTRRSTFVSEATQGFLANMVGTVERVLQDVLVDRDILAQSLNLHMSIVGHRTNRAMNKLTVISAIFLPLTFLCGVYGMNFQGDFPEIRWRYGYYFFWVLAGAITLLLVAIMRRNKLL